MRRPSWLRLPHIKDRRKAIGRLQNLVIVLLLVSGILLAGGRAGLGLGSSISGYRGIAHSDDGAYRDYSAAAEPMCVVVTPEDELHSAAMYDGRTLEEYYSRFSAALAEALGSAGEPEVVSEDEWKSAISGRGVYFDYYSDYQLSSLAIWLGSEMNGGAAVHTARRLCLSLQDEEVALYYIHGRNGTIYRCTTELSYTSLYTRVRESTPNDAQFAFEAEGLDLVDPYCVITSGDIELRTMAGENSLDQGEADRLMEAFGLNSSLAQDYTEADGTDVYLEGNVTLRLGADGTLRYTNRSDFNELITISPVDAVDITRNILENTVGLENGVAQLRLSYIMMDSSTGEWTLRYDYAVDGLPVVIRSHECAAEFRLTGAVVTGAQIIFRSYSFTGVTEHPLPAELAAALVQADGGGSPRLAYVDTNGTVSAEWLVE